MTLNTRLPTRLETQRAGQLPTPRRTRWQPLRVGLLDLFHYDHQEFWFRDGRLLWRGNNGTGKSKVLALTLPFLLDGDVSAHRVEPDGDPHKRMEWNLLLGGRYPERLGYTWIEFARLDDDGTERYLTAGIALKAAAGRGIADRWYFVTDRRVGDDLFLLTPTGTALTRDRLVDALGARGTVVRTAEQYRRMLDERLFQLGADRYGALVDLLVQLRQPQLSKRPDAELLSRALSEALTPLDPGLLADVAAGFHDLEQQRNELRSLTETSEHVRRFLGRYTRYAGTAARRQARDVRTAQSHYEDAGRQLVEVRGEAARAEADRDGAAQHLAAVRRALAEQSAIREQLTESKELRDYDRAHADAAEAAKRADAAGRRLADARAERSRRENRLATAQDAAEQAAERRETALQAAEELAVEAAARPAHDAVVGTPGLLADPTGLRRALVAVADDRTSAVHQVRRLAADAGAAATELASRRSRLAALEADRDAAADSLVAADEDVAVKADELVAAWQAYAADTDLIEVPYPEEVGLPAWTLTLDGPEPASVALDERAQQARRELARRAAAAEARLADVQGRITELSAEQAELAAGGIRTPTPSPTRDQAGRTGRPGAPLWRVVDVRPDLPDDDRAGLEAALEAAGLLDAWLTPEGALLDRDQRDAVLLAGGGEVAGPTLADVLHPAIDPEDAQARELTDDVVRAVLRAVAVHPDGDALAAASPSGTGGGAVTPAGDYRLGTLHGRWTKPAAEYLGAGAREQARRLRLAELATALVAAEAELAQVRRELDDVADAEARLTALLDARPSEAPLRQAHVSAAAARADLARRQALLPPAQAAVDEAREVADAARSALEEAAAALGLPTGTAALEAVELALARYRTQCADLAAAVQRHLDLAAEAASWATELAAAQEVLAVAVEVARLAADEAATAEAALRALTESLGATVAELQARLERAVQEIRRLGDEQTGTEARHTDAVLRVGRAEGLLKGLTEEQATRAELRDDTVEGLRALTGSGLLAAAAPDLEPPDPEQAWPAGPAVRLARSVEVALAEIDDSDTAWKRIQEEITRRFNDLTEALTRHGHQAHAELRDGRYVVAIVYAGRERAPGDLLHLLTAEIALRDRELTSREQEVLEQHLVGDVAARLQELITEADDLVGWMNAELAERPTSTGMRLRLGWRPDPDGPEGLAEARGHLLRQTAQLWSADDRRAVRDFLQRQIQRERADDPQGTWTEHLSRALDYRTWHRFVIERWQDGSWRSATGPASGGERVLTVSLPLFAAASAHYRSAHPHAPRLVLLDEAFAGVDDDARAKCLGLLTQFDLDVAMTSEREWGFYATVPGIASYQLVRRDGVDAVHVTAWEWDGAHAVQVDRALPPPQAPRRTAEVDLSDESGEEALF